MRFLFAFSAILFGFLPSFAQFSTDQLQVSFGYSIHNAHAKRFNHLVDVFNNTRYPLEIKDNLNNIHWMRGFEGGGNYLFTEDIRFHANLRSRKQFIECEYADTAMYRQYLFRVHTLDAGGDMKIGEEGHFTHWAGAGVLLGVMGVFTNWTSEEGYKGSRKMINIDHTAVLGLSLAYEAQLKLHDNLRIFLRPTAHYALGSHVRKLTDFFAPQINSDGLSYGEGEADKYDSGTLNGVGVSGGIIFQLPQF